MSKVYWGLALGLAILLLGIFLGRATKKIPPATVYTIDTTIVRELIHDTTTVTETVVLSKTDTLYITADTPIGAIPARTVTFTDSIPFVVGGQRASIPLEVGVTYRGLLYRYTLTTKPRPYTIGLKQRAVDFYGTAGVAASWPFCLHSEFECGATLWGKVSVYARGQMSRDDLTGLAGVKYHLF